METCDFIVFVKNSLVSPVASLANTSTRYEICALIGQSRSPMCKARCVLIGAVPLLSKFGERRVCKFLKNFVRFNIFFEGNWKTVVNMI